MIVGADLEWTKEGIIDVVGLRTCKLCHEVKPLNVFPWYSVRGERYRRSRCNSCSNTLKQQQRAADVAKYREYERRSSAKHRLSRRIKNRAWRLRHNFGMSVEGYEQMLTRQHGLCAICGRPKGKYRLAVDHDHRTEAVRGLLCPVCNKYLHVLESWEHRAAAETYLRNGGV